MKQPERKLIQFTNDPAVDDLLAGGRERAAARHLSPAARRARAKDKARNKLTIDLPQSLEDEIKRLAEELSIPVSGLAVYLLSRGLQVVSKQELSEARKPSRSPRFEYVIPMEGEND